MKITIFIGGLSGGGAERVACNLANHLAVNNRVTILSMADDEATYGLDSKVERVNLITAEERKNVLYNFLLRYWRLYKYVGSSKDDAFVIMLPITILMFFSLRWRTKAKVIASERNLPSTYPAWQQWLLRRLATKADGWVFQTRKQMLWYGIKNSITGQTIIPNAINSIFVLNKEKAEVIRNNKIVNVGRLNPQKNQALLIKAFASISLNFPHYVLSLYGDGGLKESLLALSKELGVEKKVEFNGFVKDIKSEISNAALFVLSSDFEGMPNALMEAMALGLPCVSTDCGGGGARALIKDEINGLLVPCNDVEALANAMEKLLRERDIAEKLGKEAQKICFDLSPSKIYDEWECFIAKIIGK